MRLLHLCCLLLAATCCFAMSEAEAKDRLLKALVGCKNKQVCCETCIDTGSGCKDTMICVGDESIPKPTKAPACSSFSHSVIGSALRLRHTAYDYRVTGTGAGCAPCGQPGAQAGGMVPSLSLTRVHFQDTDIRTSLGTKTGFSSDIWLHCYPPGNVAGGHPTGKEGWQILVSQPQPQPLDFLVLTDPGQTGTYTPEQGFENRGLSFTDAAGLVVTDPRLATAATLQLVGGDRMEFEVYTETDAAQPRGRLLRYVDKNGNALIATWKYAVDDPTMVGSLRSKLAIRDSLTDAHGRTIRFTYDEARQRSGAWVVTRIDLPDGNSISYEYAVQANVWFGTEERLSRVVHPDGSVSSFTGVSDPSVPGMRWTVDDPASDSAGSRRKTIWFSQGTWVNPVKPTEKTGQIFGRVVRIADGDGTDSFFGWFGNFPKAGGGTESRTYVWDRGNLHAFVHEDGYKLAGAYTWVGVAGADPFTADWNGWRKSLDRGYSGSTLPGSITTPEGFSAVYERDPVTQRQTRATYQDGTVERWVRNALGDVTLHRDRLGRLTETTYDAVGNRLSVTRGWIAADPDKLDDRTKPDGVTVETWAYWTADDAGHMGAGLPGQLRSHSDPRDASEALADPTLHRTDYLYHANGDLRSVVQSADVPGGVRAFDLRLYDDAGRLVERRDERGIPTKFDYDANGRLEKTTWADSSYELVTYATSGLSAGLETSHRDRNGNVTVTDWDAAGRRISNLRLDSHGVLLGRQAWTWIPGTQLPASETTDGELATFGYDGEMRRTTTTRWASGGSSLTETQIYAGDRQVATVDAYGRRTFLVRDAEERIVRTIRERLPNSVSELADLGTLPRLGGADPSYVIDDTGYDAEGQVVARIDGNGRRTALAYDAFARLASVTEAADLLPATTAYRYDAAGNRVQVTSPRGVHTRMTYTGRNLLASVTEAWVEPPQVSSETTLVRLLTYTPTRKVEQEWDANNASKAMGDPARAATIYSYGGCCDRLRIVTDPAGFPTNFDYDYVGNRIAVMDPLLQSSRTDYDGRNRPLKQSNSLNESQVTTYDDDLTDGIGLDADPQLASVLPALGFVSGFADGSAIASSDPAGGRTVQVRDGLGRVVAQIDPLGHATTLAYDGLHPDGTVVTRRIDALGHVTSARSDGLGRTVVTVDAAGQETVSRFDAVGNQLGQATRVGAEVIGWSAGYDSLYRLLFRSDTRTVDSGTTQWSYDLDGNRLSETDAEAKTEFYEYDLRNRRTVLRDRLGTTSETRFAYDAVGNLVSISDAENRLRTGVAWQNGLTQYAYDVRHLLVAEAFPIGQRGRTLRTYAYDGGRRLVGRQVGQLSGPFNASAVFAGSPQATTYHYDQANRLTRRGYADGLDDGFGYDVAGRLILATSGRYGNQVGRVYDAAGRLTSEQLTIAAGVGLLGRVLLPAQYTVGYGYDADHRLVNQTYPDGRQVQRSFTARDQLELVRLDGQPVARRDYDAAGRLVGTTTGDGLVETRGYVAGDHLVQSITTPGVTAFGYMYDADRRKLSETDALSAVAGQGFDYDDAGRLIAWRQGAQVQTWNLSLVGDWTSTTRNGVVESRRHTAVHEATRVGDIGLSYDVKGNLTKDELGQTLLWDEENRLREARRLNDSDPNRASYAYDALGRRISKTVEGMRTDYVNAGAQTVQTYGVRATAKPSEVASDGSATSLTQLPASGSLLPVVAGKQTVRVNFQPSYEPIPTGYIADKGRVLARRTNGKSYGWTADRSGAALVRGMLDDAAYDTLIPLGDQQWRLALANGSYTVAVIAGDAAATDSVNDLVVNGIVLSDPENPPPGQPGYARGDFDGWAIQVTVTDGYLTIASGAGAVSPKLCLVEIGPRNVASNLSVVGAAVAARVQAMSDATATGNNDRAAAKVPRTFVYGGYVDEVLGYVTGRGAQQQRFYPHYNHLYSAAALTNAAGQVVERYRYDAYGKQTITSATGVVRAKSAVGYDRGFTGYVTDTETGLLHARARQYSSGLGRFLARDTWSYVAGKGIWAPAPMNGYHDGFSLYGAYMVPNRLDWSGAFSEDPDQIRKELEASICSIMKGQGRGPQQGQGNNERGVRVFDGPGGLTPGSTITGAGRLKITDDEFGKSQPPAGSVGGPVGTGHSHPWGTGAGESDLDKFASESSANGGRRVDFIMMLRENCCDGDPKLYGVKVEVWIWSGKGKYDEGDFRRRYADEHARSNEPGISDNNRREAAESRERNRNLAGYLHDQGLLEYRFTFEKCCPLDDK